MPDPSNVESAVEYLRGIGWVLHRVTLGRNIFLPIWKGRMPECFGGKKILLTPGSVFELAEAGGWVPPRSEEW